MLDPRGCTFASVLPTKATLVLIEKLSWNYRVKHPLFPFFFIQEKTEFSHNLLDTAFKEVELTEV